MKKIKVAILRGGPGNKHEVSLKSGEMALLNLDHDQFDPWDVLIEESGEWMHDGRLWKPYELLRRVDVVLNALHGVYGEDGQVQRLLDQLGVPYTGSGASASAIAIHKGAAKDRFVLHNIRTPAYCAFPHNEVGDGIEDIAHEVFHTVSPPYVVKPISGRSSLGVQLASSFDELTEALNGVYARGPFMVERQVCGRGGACCVVEGLRDEELYALPPVEIIQPRGKDLFDYDAKYSGEAQEICPSNFTEKQKETMMNMARKVHKTLGLKHYSRTDFTLATPGVYALGINTLPGLTDESSLPKSLDAVGVSLKDFLSHILSLALKGR